MTDGRMTEPSEDIEQKIRRQLAERARLIGCWRGRRLLACRAAEDLHDVIAGLAEDSGSDSSPEGGLPAPPSEAQICEMQNMAANLLRTILLWNDGSVSRQRLQRF